MQDRAMPNQKNKIDPANPDGRTKDIMAWIKRIEKFSKILVAALS